MTGLRRTSILILGLGSIGRRHARVLRSLRPDASIFALRSGKGWGPEEGIKDIHDLSEVSETTDLAIIASPTDLHRAHVEKVLPLRPFLFLEKPLALTLSDGEAIVAAIEKAGLGSYVGCVFRFHPELKRFHDAFLKHPRPIRSVQASCRSWLPDWQPGREYRTSFRADPLRSGGVHLELIHELDYVTWIFGAPRTRTVALREAPELGITVPAEAHYELTYPDFIAKIDLSYASHERERKLAVTFADGTEHTIDLLRDSAGMDELYAAQLQHVLACIEGQEHSLHTAREALRTLKLALP